MDIKLILFSKKALVIVIVVLLTSTIGYLFNQLRIVQKTQESPATVTPFEKAKYEMIPLSYQDQEATLSSQNNTPPPRVYTYWKATVAYLPLPDIFVGSVKTETITEYRLAKKLIVAHLTEKGINVCDLHIFWSRPEAVEKEELERQDVHSDGCE